MRASTILACLAIGLSGTVLFFAALLAASALPVQDLAQYWSAAHLVRQNPYSLQLVTAFEKASGVSTSSPIVLRYPPWAILFVLPLRLFSYKVSFALWTLFSIFVVVVCARRIWKLYTIRDSLAPMLISLLFGPTVVLLLLGQWTIMVLLGITIFLISVERGRDKLAGASLLLVLGKPHVMLLFLVVVGLWIVRRSKWAVLISSITTLAGACAAILLLNSHIFSQFLERTSEWVNEKRICPNIAGVLYSTSGIHGLALLPEIAGVLWVFLYWFRRGHEWDWKREGMLVLLVSVICSYYSFPYDEILVLPALIAAYHSGNRKVFLVCFVATNIGYALYVFQIAGSLGFSYMFLSWTATAWLITYAASTTVPQAQAKSMAAEQN